MRIFLSSLFLVLMVAPWPISAMTLELKGRIADENGEPLEGVRVELQIQRSAFEAARDLFQGILHADAVDATVTNTAGWFTLKAPEQGFYRIRVELDGYIPMALSLHPLVESRVLHSLDLTPALVQKITLVGAEGAPLAKGWVRLNWRPGSARPWDVGEINRKGWRPGWRSAMTGTDGSVQLPVVAGEDLLVQAGRGDLVRALKFSDSSHHGGLNVARDGARALELAEVETRPVRIVDAEGRPAAAMVEVYQGAPALTDAEGVVRLESDLVDRGSLIIKTEEGLRYRVLWKGEGEITLPPVEEHRGVVLDAVDGGAIPDAFLFTRGLWPRWTQSHRGGAYLWRTFAVSEPAGFNRPDPLHAAAAGYRGSPVFDFPDLSLEPARSIFGQVLDERGAPLAGVEVYLDDSLGGPRRISPSTSSDSQGKYRYSGLRRGQVYTVRAYLPPRPPAVGQASPGQDEVDLVFGIGGRVFGRLVDREGEPIVGGTVRIYHDARDDEAQQQRAEQDIQSASPATSTANGAFVLEGVGEGRHVLLASAPGRAKRLVPGVLVEPGSERSTGDIVLEPSVPLRLRVIDGSSIAIPEVEVKVYFQSPRRVSRSLSHLLMTELGGDGQTDAEGRLAFGGWAAGDVVRLSLSHPNFVDTHPQISISVAEIEQVLEKQSKIRGRVLDAEGAPVTQGRVTASRADGAPRDLSVARITDQFWQRDEAKFELEGLRAGRYRIGVEVEGYAFEQVVVDLEPGEVLNDLEIYMTTGSRLQGRVLSSRGDPLSGARLSTISLRRPHGQSAISRSAESNEGGGYALDGLTPGRHTLYVNHPEYRRYEAEIEVTSAFASKDIQLEGPLLRIAGRVVDGEGRPVDDAEVKLEGSNFYVQPQRSDGGFAFGVSTDGAYRLVALREGSAPAVRAVEIAGASVEGLELRLEAGARIVGRVVDLEPGEAGLLSLMAMETRTEPAFGSGIWRQGAANSDGSFTVEGLSAGKWRVTASLEGRQVRASREVIVEPGVAEVEIELELGDRGLPLMGQVLHNGTPAAGLELGRRTVTDSEGRFQLEGIQPGDLELQVRGPWGNYLWRRADWSGEEILIDMTTFHVAGQVREADGQGASTLTVRSFDIATRFSRETVTDESGRFSFPNQPAGTYRFIANDRDDRGMGAVTFDVDRDRGDVIIDLTGSADLVIEPTRSDGGPIDSLMLIAFDGGTEVVGIEEVRRSSEGFIARRLPRGTWLVAIRTRGAAFTMREVTMPGEPLRLELEPASDIQIEVPALADQPPATFRVYGEHGELYQELPKGLVQSPLSLYRGSGSIQAVPAGLWTVRVEASDGSVFEKSVEVEGQGLVKLVIE